MSSLSRRYRAGQPDPGAFMPPNLLTFGAAPFGHPERTRLTAWLLEAGWPRGHMEIAELEGYLVALIAWPVSISSGAWLPRIWGHPGWKVATKIAERSRYAEFVAMIVGFIRDLDRELSSQPAGFESSVLRGLRGREHAESLHGWGRGFMTALTLGSQGLKGRSASAGAAVHTIATSTASSAPFHSRTGEDIESAVRTLIEQRSSRGPLGPLG
jgi:yecA family protein